MAAKINFGKMVGKCKMVNRMAEILETTNEYDPKGYYALVVPGTTHVVAAFSDPFTMTGEIDSAEELLLCPINTKV